MRPGILCLLLLPACSFFSPPEDREVREYVLTWTCMSSEGCEHTEDVARIDRVTVDDYYDFHFTSTQDESFGEEAQRISSDTLGLRCYWLHFLALFGHDLERSQVCHTPGGFELQVSIPNQDPATRSSWLVKGRDLALQ